MDDMARPKFEHTIGPAGILQPSRRLRWKDQAKKKG
jgi:hypothetical protein